MDVLLPLKLLAGSGERISSRTPNSFIFILILHLQTCSVFSLGNNCDDLDNKSQGGFCCILYRRCQIHRQNCRLQKKRMQDLPGLRFEFWGYEVQPNCCITNSSCCTKYEAKLAIPHLLLQLTCILMFLMFSNLCLVTSVVGN